MSATDAPLDETGTDRRMLVILRLGGQRFAFPLDAVREIVRPPDIVPVPLGPAALVGLANIRGTVTAVVSLRRIVGLPESGLGGATRVLVIEGAAPIGLVADSVDGLLAAEGDRIEEPEGGETSVDGALLGGMIADREGPALMILDPEQVLGRAFAGMRRADKRLPSVAAPGRIAGTAEGPAEQRLDLLGFEVDRQEFALPVQAVEEVVRLPEAMSRVPHADSHVLGVVGLRDRLVPLVSLRRLLGLSPTQSEADGKILVVSMDTFGVVGLVADKIRQVLRVPAAFADPVPPLLARGGVEEVEAICRLDGGKRLVSILSVERLLRNDLVRRAVSRGEMEEAGLDQNSDAEASRQNAETFIVFRLGQVEYGVPVDAVEEILRRPARLSKVPRTPDFIEGMINVRGRALPVIDQRHRFGLGTGADSERQRIIVVSVDGVRAGFIVDTVTEVLRIPESAIGAAPELSAEQIMLMSRVATLGDRMILLLQPQQLLNRDEAGSVAEIADHGSV